MHFIIKSFIWKCKICTKMIFHPNSLSFYSLVYFKFRILARFRHFILQYLAITFRFAGDYAVLLHFDHDHSNIPTHFEVFSSFFSFIAHGNTNFSSFWRMFSRLGFCRIAFLSFIHSPPAPHSADSPHFVHWLSPAIWISWVMTGKEDLWKNHWLRLPWSE